MARVRETFPQILQTALAAAAAWLIATEAVGHARPFFAPVAAVISLGITYGQRTRRAIEISGGVAVGVLIADLLVLGIGSGTPQIALVVALAMSAAVALGGGPLLITQAATSAVLVVTIQAQTDHVSLARFVDALVGGGVGLIINLLLFPANPRVLVSRAADPVLRELAAILDDVGAALDASDRDIAVEALMRARATEPMLAQLREAVATGGETARLAPARRGHRDDLARLGESAAQIELAVRNTRVLARGTIRALDLRDHVPPDTALAVHELGEAARALDRALDDPDGPEAVHAREAALRAAAHATRVLDGTHNMSVSFLVAQVRSTAVDLLRGLGTSVEDAREAVRSAAGQLGD